MLAAYEQVKEDANRLIGEVESYVEQWEERLDLFTETLTSEQKASIRTYNNKKARSVSNMQARLLNCKEWVLRIIELRSADTTTQAPTSGAPA